jgi:hypothetical protein
MVVERGKKRDPETAIRHGIEQAVARGGKEEIHPQCERVHSGHAMPKSQRDHDQREKSSEDERMGEPPVSPKVSISDSKAKTNYIKVRYDRTRYANHPNTFRNLGFVEASADTEGCHRM